MPVGGKTYSVPAERCDRRRKRWPVHEIRNFLRIRAVLATELPAGTRVARRLQIAVLQTRHRTM